MEKTSSSTLSDSYSLVHFLRFLVLIWIAAFRKFYSSSRSLFQLQFQLLLGISKCLSEDTQSEVLMPATSLVEAVDHDEILSGKDVEMVMENLRIAYKHDQEMVQGRLSSSDLSNIFDDMEPSLQEIKDAFDIFDENRDGFVDAIELQSILRRLGLKEASMVEDCAKMIRNYDENGDGKVDFHEFVKLMESSFC
ncbi:hypothetical protein ACHQM5_022237 [Ranunculus cassubicifolius]